MAVRCSLLAYLNSVYNAVGSGLRLCCGVSLVHLPSCDEVTSVRTDLARLVKALKAQKPPKWIWQKPFDYDPSHFKRLCSLNGAEPAGTDLVDYANDMRYEQSPLQPDLFRYLMPICMDVWHKDLLANGRSRYGGFVEHFWAALAEHTVLGHLNQSEYDEVQTFMTAALLDRIDRENRLEFSGMGASPYTWFYALGSFCVVFPALPPLWKIWWEMTTPGQACAGLQYLSCLLYENYRNPIFAPWTPVGGGGPPALWEIEGHIYEHGWRAENVAYVKATLTTAYIEDRLRCAARTLKDVVQSPVPQQMLNDFVTQSTLLELRLAELPSLLLESPMGVLDWSV